nr:hypothetical protein CFP56_76853 [Quercus suber]
MHGPSASRNPLPTRSSLSKSAFGSLIRESIPDLLRPHDFAYACLSDSVYAGIGRLSEHSHFSAYQFPDPSRQYLAEGHSLSCKSMTILHSLCTAIFVLQAALDTYPCIGIWCKDTLLLVFEFHRHYGCVAPSYLALKSVASQSWTLGNLGYLLRQWAYQPAQSVRNAIVLIGVSCLLKQAPAGRSSAHAT